MLKMVNRMCFGLPFFMKESDVGFTPKTALDYE
jgi:hypothetical protein